MLSSNTHIRLSPSSEGAEGGAAPPPPERRSSHYSASQFRTAATCDLPLLLRLMRNLPPHPGHSWFHDSIQFISAHGVSAPILYSLCLFCESPEGARVLGATLLRSGVSLDSNQLVDGSLLAKLPFTGFMINGATSAEEASVLSTGKVRKQTSLWVPAGKSLFIGTNLLETHVAEISEPGHSQSSIVQLLGNGRSLAARSDPRDAPRLSIYDKVRVSLAARSQAFLALHSSNHTSVEIWERSIQEVIPAKRSARVVPITGTRREFAIERLKPSRFDIPPYKFTCSFEACTTNATPCIKISNEGPAGLFLTFERSAPREKAKNTP
jgi:hypothetical protein